jgi:uncharacterized protein (DUF362 family)
VTIARGEEQLSTARECIGDQLQAVIRPGSRVLLKVNQVGGNDPARGATVHPELIGLVAEMAMEAGAAEVGICEDAGRFGDTTQVFERLGTTQVARRVGAQLIDLRLNPYVMRQAPGGGLVVDEMEFAQPLLDWEVLIGVTKLKTHHQAGVSGALKNMFGAIPDDYKRRFHRGDLDKALVDINSIRKPDFTIVDAFPAMEGVGPRHGTPKKMDLCLSGRDSVALDAVGQAIMGFGPAYGRAISLAAEKGLGVADLGKIEVRGLPISSVASKFQGCIDQIKKEVEGYVEIIGESECNGCSCAIGTTFMLLRRRYGIELNDMKGLRVYFGDARNIPDADDENVVIVGDCVKGQEGKSRFIPGCPPTITSIMNLISAKDVELASFGKGH